MGCPKCGCDGIHACTGHPPKPWTEEDKARLQKALEEVFHTEKQHDETAQAPSVGD